MHFSNILGWEFSTMGPDLFRYINNTRGEVVFRSFGHSSVSSTSLNWNPQV